MWALHLGLGLHLKLSKSPMDYFKMNLHVVLHLGLRFHSNATKLHIDYLKLTLHVDIAFRVRSSFKVT
jgi:hypothetical protein